MAKTKKRKRRRSYAKRIRRRLPKRLSILTTVGIAAGATVSINDRDSLANSILAGVKGERSLNDVGADVLVQTIGYDPRDKGWRIPSFTALTLLGVVASKVVGRFVPPSTFNAIPFIGKKLKM